MIVDKNSFEEMDSDLKSSNPLEFEGYEEKLEKYKEKTKQNEAVLTGKATIEGCFSLMHRPREVAFREADCISVTLTP